MLWKWTDDDELHLSIDAAREGLDQATPVISLSALPRIARCPE